MMELSNTLPGYFEIRAGENNSGWYLDFNCPCGCGDNSCVALYCINEPVKTHAWFWSGTKEKPTLAPSLRRMTACAWHGFLDGGIWKSAGDGAPTAANVYGGPP